MAKRRTIIDRLPLAPVFALMFGTAVAIVIAATPQWLFEGVIASTGLGNLLDAARPPLGLKARLLAVVLGFALVAILVWLAVTAVQRLVARRVPQADSGFDDELDLGAYVDSLPPVDARRRPIFADKELGAPFMSDEALTSVPVAVLTPRQSIIEPEPVVVPEASELVVETDAVVAVSDLQPEDLPGPEIIVTTIAGDSTLAAPLDVAEFNLPPADAEPETLSGETSIDTLIRRLEAGLARRAGPPPPSPPSPAANPIGAMRDWMVGIRQTDEDNDPGSVRALDTLQRLSARRMAG